MSPLPRTHLACLVLASALVSGCSTLGGNVGGDFACRAPEGSCAPTTVIDSAAIDASLAGPTGRSQLEAVRGSPIAQGLTASERSLQIVIAARRDAAGRTHEARVVHVVLPEPASESWRQSASTGDLLRAIGHALTPQAGEVTQPEQPAPSDQNSNSSFLQLPDQLFPPSLAGSATSGVSAPESGAPGSSPLPRRVPHSFLEEGLGPYEGEQP